MNSYRVGWVKNAFSGRIPKLSWIIIPFGPKVNSHPTLSQRIKRMESEFQLKFAALVFQSHSEIMLKLIQLRFSNGIKLKILSESQIGRCYPLMFNDPCHLSLIWSLHNATIVQDNCDSALISKFIHSLPWFSQTRQKNELTVLNFPQNSSNFVFPS